MRRWLIQRLDDAMLPLLKVLTPGYQERLPRYRAPKPCSIRSLESVRAPEQVKLEEQPPWQGCRTLQYRFESPVEALCEENRTVSGLLLEIDPEAPWVLIVPGFATGALRGTYSFFQTVQGRSLIDQEINVALIDTPYHMLRRRKGRLSGEGFFSPDLEQTQNALLQGAGDAIALIRWLQERSGKRVGLWGTSLGGCIAGLVATRLPDLAAVVLMEPMDNPGDLLATLPSTADIRAVLQAEGLTPAEIATALREVAPSSHPPAVAKERVLFITPKWDRVVPTRFQERFWEAWGRPERIVVDASHVTTATDRLVNAEAVAFLIKWTQYATH